MGQALRRAMVVRPEVLVGVASLGQSLLQIFDLARIPIVKIHSYINYMKLDEYTQRQNLWSNII
jgi:hypothetical protein